MIQGYVTDIGYCVRLGEGFCLGETLFACKDHGTFFT